LKVLHIGHSDIVGGANIATTRLSESLRRIDISSTQLVRLKITNDPTVKKIIGGKFGRVISSLRRIIGRAICTIFDPNIYRVKSMGIIPSFVSNKINKISPDIVHLQWIGHETMSIKDIMRVKQPLVWTCHDLWPISGAEHISFYDYYLNGYKNTSGNALRRDILNRWVWKNKKNLFNNKNINIVAPSKWMAKQIKKSTISNNLSISVIPNAIDTELWRPVKKNEARRALNIPFDKKVILFGLYGDTNVKNKGFDLLVKALAKIEYDKSKIIIMTFGGENKESIEALGYKMRNFGFISEGELMRNIYSVADIYVMPSRIESFGQTASEASACGTPVVAFNGTGVADIVQHKKSGWLAKQYDTSDFANGIDYLLSESNNLKLISKNAREHIIKNFSYHVVSNKYNQLYNKILSCQT
jgi:glycosyltransferase involved in cell wall biosynthesis